MTDSAEYTRLHITPLTATLLPSLLPPSILPNARNISYHTIQTFPERPYGFVELPTMDAMKLKKKLHGSILKGTKICIETANPKPDLMPAEPEPVKPKREKKKRKRDEIPGVEIERSVKRGWTEPGLTKKEVKDGKRVKSKHTNGKECLFKTVLPPNVAAKDTLDKKKRRDRKTVVHEFEKTEKYATFLRDPAAKNESKGVKEFVEGRGWVDEEGNVVEVVTLNAKPALESKNVIKKKEATPEERLDESSSEEEIEKAESAQAAEEASSTSTSGSSSDEQSEQSDEDDSTSSSDSPSPKPAAEIPKKSSRPASSAGLTISIPNSAITSTPISGQVHPLEALYKKSTADPSAKPTESAFSFFGADNDEDEVEESRDQMPLTPFTQRDFEFRGTRSAAPTPDTAHASKRFKWPTDNPDSDEDSDEEEEQSSPVRKTDAKGKAKAKEDSEEPKEEQSDFAKLFYEKRGEMTRAWKKRRKVVSKENRQRENRKSGNRA